MEVGGWGLAFSELLVTSSVKIRRYPEDVELLFEAFDQMVMHVCSWLMRFAELSKWILLSSKKLGERGELPRCMEGLAHLQAIAQLLAKDRYDELVLFQSFPLHHRLLGMALRVIHDCNS